MSDLEFLIGTWKIEDLDSYESWGKVSASEFKGETYKLVQGGKTITETLVLAAKDGEVIYEATVLNQNNGQAVPFQLNTNDNQMISFENLTHDFPTRIQYKVISDSKILVKVSGEDDEGFSYYLDRQ